MYLNKQMKPIIPHIILFLTLCSCISSHKLVYLEHPEWWNEREVTTARLYSIDKISDQEIAYSFEVNGNEAFGASIEDTYNWVEGIEVDIAYCPRFPREKNKLLLYTKKIPDTTEVAYALGTIFQYYSLFLYEDKNIIRINYEYRVLPNSRIYTSSAYYIDHSKSKSIYDFMGKSFLVSYDINFPKRNQIHFDTALEDTKVFYAGLNRFTRKRLKKAIEKTPENGSVYWLPIPGENPDNHYKKKRIADDISSKHNVEIHIFTSNNHYSKQLLLNPTTDKNKLFWHEKSY